MRQAETICALATPAGEGALGIIRVSGEGALALLRRASGRGRFPPRALRLCRIRAASGELLDQVLACYQPAPRTYTGEDTVELFAHGGTLNLRRLLARLVELGARPAEPGEFTRRAFLNGRLDLTQAEAVARIISARSERALRNAQALHTGELRARVEAVRASLLALAAELEAAIDFAEELPLGTSARERCAEAEAVLATLAASYQAGRRLERARVALVGAANVGKSSLFNRLLGVTRALTAPDPGTTRDYLEAEVEWEGERLTLVDSAGLRADGSPLELDGLRLAAPVLASCDLLLVVHDLSAPTPLSLPPELAPLPRLELGSKADLVAADAAGPALRTSAKTGEGLAELRQRIREALAGGGEESLLVSEERQALKLVRAREELQEVSSCLAADLPPELAAQHLRAALRALAELTGELTSEAVLDEVFARFCIGK